MTSKELTALEALDLLKKLKKNNIDDQEVEDMLLDIIEKELKEHRLLKKLEEELEIDLITLFKTLKQKFVYHREQVKIELLGLHIKSEELYLYGFVEDTTHAVYLKLKDCGKTWTMTKEKL